ncbi:hypothetical protein LAZ67_2002127 [Cordylochernes scorpioides]|uniref:Uncharacterized protein n=1 Tax=Cordylochernes scorpioides TaxID=51811 RepID=A0ABY6K2K0_9ARAC|nr:hypothetical protein LAZ67_2002127 [Cordylochernes scorpioides]
MLAYHIGHVEGFYQMARFINFNRYMLFNAVHSVIYRLQALSISEYHYPSSSIGSRLTTISENLRANPCRPSRTPIPLRQPLRRLPWIPLRFQGPRFKSQGIFPVLCCLMVSSSSFNPRGISPARTKKASMLVVRYPNSYGPRSRDLERSSNTLLSLRSQSSLNDEELVVSIENQPGSLMELLLENGVYQDILQNRSTARALGATPSTVSFQLPPS